MKMNWGTGLVIGMLLFISFILFFVITMSTDKKYSYDLVTEEYYKKEMELQDNIDAQQNSAAMTTQIIGVHTKEGYLLQFPNEYEPEKISGKVFLYRPSNKQLDFDFPIEMSNSHLLIPNKRLLDGRWNITVDWEYNHKRFRYKKSITY
ncbi:nitrogen fixation protein FixH [Gillisia sp. Hel_I_86]|uniref:FixH family protein n=1 Tax=Gillisia sp. Hel_I_86 TaxID=1249981 RepID=UPI00119C6733|nr:FixH family protein [Gillisia sp. Hel_I_86]TVZ25528.1 nitrogen fixation protein FixH [Gillisia sp. Hel_I_86]